MSDQLPWGEVGDLVEELVPIAAELVVAVREEGPDAIRDALARVPEAPAAIHDLPGGAFGVLAVVCAAMVDRDASITSLLAWAEANYPDATEAEWARLHGLNISPGPATVLAMNLHTAGGEPAIAARKARRAQQRRRTRRTA